MKRIGLATYSIKIRARNKARNEGYCNFDMLPKERTLFNADEASYYDAYDILFEILNVKPRFEDPTRNIISDVMEIKKDEDRIIYGFLGYGEYGTPRKIVDKLDKDYMEDLAENKGVENRFYFMFKLPKGQDIGVLFLERRGNYGLKTLLDKGINKKLGKHQLYQKFIIDIDSLIDKRVFEKYITKGVIHSLNYIRTSIPKNSFRKRKYVEGQLEVKVKFKGHPHLKDIFEHVNIFDNKDKAARDEFLSFNGENYQDLTFKMDVGDAPRTFRYEHPEKTAPYLDITNELGGKKENHSLEAIHEVAKKYEKEMISNIWKTD